MSLYRMVVGFGDDGMPVATVTYARGSSEDPKSPHFGDRDASWAAVSYEKLAFRRADVEAREESRFTVAGGGK